MPHVEFNMLQNYIKMIILICILHSITWPVLECDTRWPHLTRCWVIVHMSTVSNYTPHLGDRHWDKTILITVTSHWLDTGYFPQDIIPPPSLPPSILSPPVISCVTPVTMSSLCHTLIQTNNAMYETMIHMSSEFKIRIDLLVMNIRHSSI